MCGIWCCISTCENQNKNPTIDQRDCNNEAERKCSVCLNKDINVRTCQLNKFKYIIRDLGCKCMTVILKGLLNEFNIY